MAPKSLCLTTACAPVPRFLGGFCPLGCSLSAPATGGFSVVSLQCNMYAAGSEKEKGAGGRLHGGTIAHPFVFCNGGVAGPRTPASAHRWGRMVLSWPAALHQRRDWLGLRRCPTGPPSNVFGYRGTPPCTPGGGCAPCTLLEGTEGASFAHLARWEAPCQVKEKDLLPSFPLRTGAGMGGFAGGGPSNGPNSPCARRH